MASKREAVEKAERAFKLFDKDNDGFITKDEFQKISKKLSRDQVRPQGCHFGSILATNPANVSPVTIGPITKDTRDMALIRGHS